MSYRSCETERVESQAAINYNCRRPQRDVLIHARPADRHMLLLLHTGLLPQARSLSY